MGEDYGKVANHEYVSVVRAAATTRISFTCERPQAGFHLYAPLAAYPVYTTQLLEAGVYLFAAAFALTKVGDEDAKLPDPKEYLEKLIEWTKQTV